MNTDYDYPEPLIFGPLTEALKQIAEKPIWDGNLISKQERDKLFERGLIFRCMGWNCLSELGVRYAVVMGFLRS